MDIQAPKKAAIHERMAALKMALRFCPCKTM